MTQLFGSLSWRADNALFNHEDIARSHISFTTIHPFHNGNGRLARIWAHLLADHYGLPRPQWGQRKSHISALRSADERLVIEHLYDIPTSRRRAPTRRFLPDPGNKTGRESDSAETFTNRRGGCGCSGPLLWYLRR